MATFRLLIYFYQEYINNPINPTTQKVYVNAIYFWKGFWKEQAGVYLNTNLGIIYFSTFQKVWCSSDADLSTVDIDGMEAYVLQKTGLTLKELGRMTERKFGALKRECRERGIYL